jgi:hypothetical protein
MHQVVPVVPVSPATPVVLFLGRPVASIVALFVPPLPKSPTFSSVMVAAFLAMT